MGVPADIKEIAETRVIPRGLDGNHYRSTLVQHIERAIMDERERCAEVAEFYPSQMPDREDIAKAIRSGVKVG